MNVPQKASDIISLLLRWYVHLEPKEASSTVRNSASWPDDGIPLTDHVRVQETAQIFFSSHLEMIN